MFQAGDPFVRFVLSLCGPGFEVSFRSLKPNVLKHLSDAPIWVDFS